MCVKQAYRGILVRRCLGNWCAVVLVVAVAGTVPGVGLELVWSWTGAGDCRGGCRWMLVLWNVEWLPVGLVDGVEQFLYFYK